MPSLFAPRRFVLLLALSVALTSFGGMATPAAVQATWDVDRADATSEELLAGLTNESRANGGLPTLAVDPELVDLARWRSRDMAERGYFSHAIPPAGTKVFDELSARGYCYKVAGENIGWLSGPDAGAEARIQQMFLASERHRDVLMGAAWDVVGVGSWKRADGRHYWTVLFAEPCDPKPSTEAAPAAPALVVSFVLGLARLLPGG
jgi:uncharacterized protein YkwD